MPRIRSEKELSAFSKEFKLKLQEAGKDKEASLQGRPARLFDEDAELSFSDKAGGGKDTPKETIVDSLKDLMNDLYDLRSPGEKKPALDISLSQFLNKRLGMSYSVNKSTGMESPTALYELLDINTASQSIMSLYTTSDVAASGMHWLVPEIIRAAVLLGLRRSPIYPKLISEVIPVDKNSITMPELIMSDARMYELNEASDMPLGNLAFNENTVQIKEYGLGLTASDQVVRELTINLFSRFFVDLGVKLGLGMSRKAILTLLNGNDKNGTAVGSIGTTTNGAYAYTDFLRTWIRSGMLGYNYSLVLGSEESLNSVLNIAEFKGFSGESTKMNIEVDTPMPTKQIFIPTGNISSDNQLLFVDPANALVMLSYYPLRIERERIMAKRFEKVYATIGFAFSTLFNQARLVVNKGGVFSAFPAGFDYTTQETEGFRTTLTV